MKNKLLLLVLLFATTFSFAAFTEKKASTSPQMEAHGFAHMTVKEYGELRGKKLNFFERIAFRSAQSRMQREHGDYHGFNGLGFVLGLFFSLVGIIAVSVLSTDRNLRKWTWIGAGVSILISLLFLL